MDLSKKIKEIQASEANAKNLAESCKRLAYVSTAFSLLSLSLLYEHPKTSMLFFLIGASLGFSDLFFYRRYNKNAEQIRQRHPAYFDIENRN